jgi:hypothetical protein
VFSDGALNRMRMKAAGFLVGALGWLGACSNAPAHSPSASAERALDPRTGFVVLAVREASFLKPGVLLTADDGAELAEIWDDFELPGAIPGVDFEAHRAVVFGDRDRCHGGNGWKELRRLWVQSNGESDGVLRPEFIRDEQIACEEAWAHYVPTIAYILAVRRDQLPNTRLTLGPARLVAARSGPTVASARTDLASVSPPRARIRPYAWTTAELETSLGGLAALADERARFGSEATASAHFTAVESEGLARILIGTDASPSLRARWLASSENAPQRFLLGMAPAFLHASVYRTWSYPSPLGLALPEVGIEFSDASPSAYLLWSLPVTFHFESPRTRQHPFTTADRLGLRVAPALLRPLPASAATWIYALSAGVTAW